MIARVMMLALDTLFSLMYVLPLSLSLSLSLCVCVRTRCQTLYILNTHTLLITFIFQQVVIRVKYREFFFGHFLDTSWTPVQKLIFSLICGGSHFAIH